jgi:hypothetical protein
MVPRQARLPPDGIGMARVSPKNGKVLAIYSCKEASIQTTIYLYLSERHSKIKN